MSNLVIKDLHVSIGSKEIIKGLNLEMNGGEIHAIMGPNGTGKSTLLSTIMGHPRYTITSGSITLDGEDVLQMTTDKRARSGIFLAFQYPLEISGVTNSDFIKTAMQTKQEKPISFSKFFMKYEKSISDLKMNEGLAHRYLNEGFSGGEKKRNEILQMKMLEPKFAFLDEIDSGLDVDALRIVSENINSMLSEDFSCLLVTHYQRLLDYVKPSIVHVMINGTIVKTGGPELIEKIDQEGYSWVKTELGIEVNLETESDITSLGTCATKEVLEQV